MRNYGSLRSPLSSLRGLPLSSSNSFLDACWTYQEWLFSSINQLICYFINPAGCYGLKCVECCNYAPEFWIGVGRVKFGVLMNFELDGHFQVIIHTKYIWHAASEHLLFSCFVVRKQISDDWDSTRKPSSAIGTRERFSVGSSRQFAVFSQIKLVLWYGRIYWNAQVNYFLWLIVVS